MTITRPRDGGSSFENLICPRCSASILPHAVYCSACGEQIDRDQNQQGKVHPENGEDTQKQEGTDTVRIPSFSQTHGKDLRSFKTLKNNRNNAQYSIDGVIARGGEASVEELILPSTPLPDIDTKKQGAVRISRYSEQLTTRLLSLVNEADQNLVVTRPLSKSWGWLPTLSLASAVGVFLEALAAEAGRVAAPWANWLYWFGLLVLFLPIAVRIISVEPARRERIALLIMLGSFLYFLRLLDYPLSFAYNDEFLHWRGAIDLAMYGHLFHANPLLAVGPSYPGLEIVTNALSSLTGLSIFASAMVLLGLVALVLLLSLYLLFECLSSSARVAGISTLLYMTVPGFSDQTGFSYESLALPLAIFVVFVVARRNYKSVDQRMGLTLTSWLGIAAVVITHHVTSYGLLAFLLLWTAVFLLFQTLASSQRNHNLRILAGPGGSALVSLVLIIAWTVYSGERVVGYLYPALENATQQLIQVFVGKAQPHKFFSDQTGFVAPLWERVTAFASVALILLGLPAGLVQIWRHYRGNAAILALAGAVLVYPVIQAAHVASVGAVTDRVFAFLFPAIALVLAIGITHFRLSRVPSRRRFVMIIGAIVVIFIGGWIQNGLDWYLLPGPYLVASDHRSISPEGVATAEWTLSHLGPGHRTVSDLTNAFLMGTYGYQWNVMSANEKIEVAPVFTSLELGPTEKRILQVTRTQYLVVDLRLSTSLPRMRGYFDAGEPNAGHYTSPIDRAALTKFDGMQNVSRIFDSGDIIIYDVEAITNGSLNTSKPQPQSLCTPASTTIVLPSYLNVAKRYSGTIYDIPKGTAINISLTGIQQQHGAICGSFSKLSTKTDFTLIPSNGSFKGTISTAGQIQFIFIGSAGQATFSFNGVILPSGSMSGTYCNPVASTGKCSDYGLWSVFPVRSG